MEGNNRWQVRKNGEDWVRGANNKWQVGGEGIAQASGGKYWGVMRSVAQTRDGKCEEGGIAHTIRDEYWGTTLANNNCKQLLTNA